MRSFDLPGKYLFNLTVTDATGNKVTSTGLYTNVVQEMPKKEDTGNTTLTHQKLDESKMPAGRRGAITTPWS